MKERLTKVFSRPNAASTDTDEAAKRLHRKPLMIASAIIGIFVIAAAYGFCETATPASLFRRRER